MTVNVTPDGHGDCIIPAASVPIRSAAALEADKHPDENGDNRKAATVAAKTSASLVHNTDTMPDSEEQSSAAAKSGSKARTAHEDELFVKPEERRMRFGDFMAALADPDRSDSHTA